jgi:hypothetical protein
MRSLAHIMMVKENPGAMRLAAGAERHIGNAFLIKHGTLIQV